MEEAAVQEQRSFLATSNLINDSASTFSLGELLEDVDSLIELKEKLTGALEANTSPRGTLTLIRSIDRYVHRKPLLDAAQRELKRTFDYVNGKRGNGAAKGGRVRSIRSLAHKFYDKMPESAIRRHCVVNGLDYDSYETVDARIEALVEASAALV